MPRHRSSRAVLAGATAVVGVASFTLLATGATAQEEPTWSQFQGGPGHPGVLADGPQPPFRVRWTLPAPAGEGLSPAIVADDLAVSVGEEAVYGIDIATGAVEWQVRRDGGSLSVPAIGTGERGRILVFIEGPAPTSATGSGSASATPSGAASTAPASASVSPAPDDESTETSTLVAIALSDQRELWRTELVASSRSGVTIDAGVALAGDRDGNLYAVSLADGTLLWTASVEGAINAPVAVADARVYAVVRQPNDLGVTVAAFDLESGKAAWPTDSQAVSIAGSILSVGEGELIFGSIDRFIRGLDVADGSERWATLARSLFFPSTAPALAHGTVFLADFGGGLYRIDPSDGARLWSFQFNELVIRSSPVVSGSTVLVGLNDGRLAAVDVDSGHLIWEGSPSEGLLGTIALDTDAAIAVKGGSHAGLIAFEHDPDGALVDVASPTELDIGTTLWRYTVAAASVFVIAFFPAFLIRRRVGSDDLSDTTDSPELVDEDPT